MKKIVIVVVYLILAMITNAQIPFRSGSVDLDGDLNEINSKAKLDFGAFKTELALNFNISEKKISFLRTDIKMEPAEIYFALELSKITNKSIDDVVEIYQVNRDKGWGFIAKELGVKPGSAEFHELKNNVKNKKSHKVIGKGKEKQNKGKGNK